MFFARRPKPKQKVFVGVSGGVDSSVTAAMLIDQGYDVIGVFIRTWQPDFIECTWRDERRDAMRVCAHLNIPFVELDLEKEYKEGVADYMIAEYAAGRTPNPDVMCNREVKFGGFLSWAERNGGIVATGHYARNDGNLLKGIDPSKDQSYFLWTLTQDQLKKILFPIGHLQKSEVRKLAEKYNLPTATKKDSQGICFIGDINMKDFLKHYIDVKPGSVLSETGEVIGTHDGALFYTLGERHGFVITKKGVHDAPYYVVAKNVSNNTITVSQTPATFETSKKVMLRDCVFREPVSETKKYEAQIRYHGEFKKCSLRVIPADAGLPAGQAGIQDVRMEVIFDESDYSLSSGQSVVVYDGDKCIGGGIVV